MTKIAGDGEYPLQLVTSTFFAFVAKGEIEAAFN